jgi:fucose 4-O-acetylase-like acetyltransferase
MLMVIYGHTIEPLFVERTDDVFLESGFMQWKVMYSFHMPLFFAIAGATRAIVEKRVPERDRLKHTLHEALGLVLLAAVHHVLIYSVYIVREFGQGGTLAQLKHLVRCLLLLCDYPVGLLWFLPGLAMTLVLSSLWSTQKSRWVRGGILLVCVLSLYEARRFGPSWDAYANWFQIRALAPALVFFALGKVMSGRYPHKIVGAVALGLVVVLAPLNLGCPWSFSEACPDVREHFAVWMMIGRYGYWPLFWASALLGIFAVAGLVWNSKALAFVGQRSLSLYIVNVYFFGFVVPLVPNPDVEGIGPLQYVVIFVCTVAAHLAAAVVLQKPFEALRKRCNALAATLLARLPIGRSVSESAIAQRS